MSVLSHQPTASSLALRGLAFLLLIGLGIASPGIETWAQPADRPVLHSAGCHSHHPTVPAKPPVSFQCCANGHDVAIPTVLFSLRQMTEPVSAFDETSVSSPVSFDVSRLAIFLPSASPPVAAPLRV